MLKKFNNSILNEDKKKNNDRKKDRNINLKNKNEELKIIDNNNNENDKNNDNGNDNTSKDSKDDICDMNEIEKIISKSSYNIYPFNNSNKNSINYKTIYILDKSGNELQNKKHLFLNSLYKMQSDKMNDYQSFEHNKTSFNIGKILKIILFINISLDTSGVALLVISVDSPDMNPLVLIPPPINLTRPAPFGGAYSGDIFPSICTTFIILISLLKNLKVAYSNWYPIL